MPFICLRNEIQLSYASHMPSLASKCLQVKPKCAPRCSKMTNLRPKMPPNGSKMAILAYLGANLNRKC